MVLFFCELTRQCAYYISRILTIEYFNSRYLRRSYSNYSDYFTHCQSSFVYHLDSHYVLQLVEGNVISVL
ncbi:hypothetical protein ALC56_08695 [Trachymyrmex septentrionalis]|uniref:Uncharacterized protein n=1 Tax=Trachymyrmex septentrionalis TaxID=34720 RepID=A0A195FA31_9HYME|nr:hypothetical protein ALC56_08695 [Trachymyrmex septentrionalis]